MSRFSTKALAFAFVATLITAPVVSAYAAGGDTPTSSPAPTTTKGKSKKDKSSSIEDPKFLAAYRTAYTSIYDRGDYATAIEQLKALNREDVADVANLIGYSYRKLDNYQASKQYYEQALADDPNHVRTWFGSSASACS